MSKWPIVKLETILHRIERDEKIDSEKSYSLLGIRLEGQGPFLRETVMGTQTSAAKLFRVEEGDFIYSRLFACRGAFGVIPQELNGCYVSGEFPTFIPASDKLDVNFLKYWFMLSRVIRSVDADCTGSTPLTRNRYKEFFFLALKIPLPPLAEQRRIVARIEKLAAQINAARDLRKQAISDVESFIISTHIHLSGKRKRRIKEFLQLDEDIQSVDLATSYPQVGIKSFGAGLFTKGAIEGAQTTYRAFNRLYAGALVLSQVKGWEGAIAICPPNLSGWFVSPEYRTFRCIQREARARYLQFIISSKWFWSRLSNATRGVGARRERTRPEQFLNLELPMPTIEQQQLGERFFSKIIPLKRLQVETTAELDALFPAVLDRAFKGEL